LENSQRKNPTALDAELISVVRKAPPIASNIVAQYRGLALTFELKAEMCRQIVFICIHHFQNQIPGLPLQIASILSSLPITSDHRQDDPLPGREIEMDHPKSL
jgi:hypothetical protein